MEGFWDYFYSINKTPAPEADKTALDEAAEKSVKDALIEELEEKETVAKDAAPGDFKEEDHPRGGKGSEKGGQFVKSDKTITKEDDIGSPDTGAEAALSKGIEGFSDGSCFKKHGPGELVLTKDGEEQYNYEWSKDGQSAAVTYADLHIGKDDFINAYNEADDATKAKLADRDADAAELMDEILWKKHGAKWQKDADAGQLG